MSDLAYRATVPRAIAEHLDRIEILEATPPCCVTAAFWFAFPAFNDVLGSQQLTDVDTWTALVIDPDAALNTDLVDGGPAVALVAGGTRLVVLAAVGAPLERYRHTWLVGTTVNISRFVDVDGPREIAIDNTLDPIKGYQLALRLGQTPNPPTSGFDRYVTQTVVPAPPVGLLVAEAVFDVGIGHWLHTSTKLDPSEVIYDPAADPDDRDGISVYARHNIPWVDAPPPASPTYGPPAVDGGELWGVRYSIGDINLGP